MRLGFLVLVTVTMFQATGCTAIHTIQVRSQPPGATVEMNGTEKGVTPFTLSYESGLAEKMWPEAVVFTSRFLGNTWGWSEETTEFKQLAKMPTSITFNHRKLDPNAPDPPKSPLEPQFKRKPPLED